MGLVVRHQSFIRRPRSATTCDHSAAMPGTMVQQVSEFSTSGRQSPVSLQESIEESQKPFRKTARLQLVLASLVHSASEDPEAWTKILNSSPLKEDQIGDVNAKTELDRSLMEPISLFRVRCLHRSGLESGRSAKKLQILDSSRRNLRTLDGIPEFNLMDRVTEMKPAMHCFVIWDGR
jgi:hypothetical protein